MVPRWPKLLYAPFYCCLPRQLCAGGFIDDYKLDEGYRNDLSFLYCCHVSEGRPAWLELVTTQIVHTWQVGSSVA